MEDVQDLVEMPDHLEERGQDEGAGQPGEGRTAGRTDVQLGLNLC